MLLDHRAHRTIVDHDALPEHTLEVGTDTVLASPEAWVLRQLRAAPTPSARIHEPTHEIRANELG
jgi:hypothetical protein